VRDAGANLRALLVSAVSVVLLTRLNLTPTGFPRIGGGGMHAQRWDTQFAASGGLVWDLILLAVLGYMIREGNGTNRNRKVTFKPRPFSHLLRSFKVAFTLQGATARDNGLGWSSRKVRSAASASG
jgi:hypothetical protein